MTIIIFIIIIILNYNAGKLLLDCVESIFKSDYKNFEVIIVDNRSKDSSHKECQRKYEQIILIENSENLGFCEGNNVGIRKAKGDFLIILNPDTIVKEMLKKMRWDCIILQRKGEYVGIITYWDFL